MTCQIALAGKGGTGKTTVAALTIRYLIEHGLGPVLAVDADANANLNEMLGVKFHRTVGEAREEMKSGVPTGMTKEIFMELKVQEALVEAEGFDLIVMGRPEGPGCYCYANTLLSKYLEILVKNYPFVVVDNEAGMEHISRLTTKDVDLMLVVTDPSRRGISTAKRILELTRELRLQIGDFRVIVNRASAYGKAVLEKEVEAQGLSLAGILPEDPTVNQYDLEGRPLVELPHDNPVVVGLWDILDRVIPRTQAAAGRATQA
jgi:CO dehydrogenase maturation factor